MWVDRAAKSFSRFSISPPRGARKGPLLPAAMAIALAATICLPPTTARAADSNTVWLPASGNWSDSNCWSTGEPNSRIDAFIDNAATCTINKSSESCSNLYLGTAAGLSGSVNMAAGSLTSSAAQFVGCSGSGLLIQSDGTNSAAQGFYLGRDAGSDGNCYLTGRGKLWAASTQSTPEYVGYSGAGTFTQDGNSINTVGSLYMGFEANSSGCYVLSARAGLTVRGWEYIGYYGMGTFSQTDGNHQVMSLYLGSRAGSTGIYTLGGSGRLVVTSGMTVGQFGTGLFVQSSGVNTIGGLSVAGASGSPGTYELLGRGHVACASDERIGYLGMGLFIQQDGNNVVQQDVYLGSDANASGTYQLSGSNSLLSALREYVGDRGTGTVEQTGGRNVCQTLNMANDFGSAGAYTLSGGQLEVHSECIGYWGQGSFLHTDGNNFAYSIYLASAGGASGSYTLTGHGHLAVSNEEQIGYFCGQGTFNQDDGNNVLLGTGPGLGLVLGYYRSNGWYSFGQYNLSGRGRLMAVNEYIGYDGNGVFVQSDGNNTLKGVLYLGYGAGSYGTYQLNGPGRLAANSETIGKSGMGVFTQTDGNNQIKANLYVGGDSNAWGAYFLGGSGYLSAATEYIGYGDVKPFDGNALFRQTGGWNTTSRLLIRAKGRYELAGGTLCVNGRLDANGVLDMSEESGTLLVSGGVRLKRTGLFELGAGTFLHVDSNLYASIQNDGNFCVSSGSHQVDFVLPWDLNISGGTTIIDSGATLIANKITQQSLTVNGSLSAGQVAIGLGATGKATFTIADANADVTISSLLTIAAKGSFSAVPGSVIHMTGSEFRNQSTDANALAGLANLTLTYESADANYDPFEVAGRNIGADANGFYSNFGLGTLQLGSPAGAGRVMLVDLFDNQPGWSGTEALYLQSLVVNPGSELWLNGIHLYVGGVEVSAGDGGFYGGGGIYVPEPATLCLLLAGGVGLLRSRRKRGVTA